MNLLVETIEALEENGKKVEDIKWIGTRSTKIDINRFIELANTEYDAGYGALEVAQDLIIVGDNWWLERAEYDGSEWWAYKELPKEPDEYIEIKALTVPQSNKMYGNDYIGWESLKELNEKEEK